MSTGLRLSSILSCGYGLIAFAITLGANLTGWAAVESTCPAPIAACVAPAAARHSDTAATYFHSSGVVTLAAREAECAEPIATCIQPAAYVAQLPGTGLFWRAGRQVSITELLQGWSAASDDHPPWTATEKSWLARRHQPWLSAVALETVVRLASSVKATDLAGDFIWTQESTSHEVTVLRGVPTDETQKLFCPQLRVELDTVTHALTAIDVADRAGIWRPIDLPWAVLSKTSRGADTILLTGDIEISLVDEIVGTESMELPPSPSAHPLIRFAADRIEFTAPLTR